MAMLKKQWFLVGMVLVFAAVLLDGTLSLAKAGILLKSHHGASLVILVIFLLSGLIIEIDQIRAGIRDLKATSAALAVIVALTVGGEEHSTVPAHQVLDQLAQSRSTLYVIQVANSVLRPTVPIGGCANTTMRLLGNEDA